MFRDFEGNTYQYAGQSGTKSGIEMSKKTFLATGMVRVRTNKDSHGYMMWIRPMWMDNLKTRRSELDTIGKFGSDELRGFIRRVRLGLWKK